MWLYLKIVTRLFKLAFIFIPVFLYIWLYGIKRCSKQLKLSIDRSGPVFTKVVQWLSQRRDIFDSSTLEELKSLQKNCKMIPLDKLLKGIHNDINMFKNIEEKPLGVGSIAQVHRATLKDGKKCIVKIRKPGVLETMEVDLPILTIFYKLLRLKYGKTLDVLDIDGVLRGIQQQALLTNEKENLDRLKHIFKGDNTVKFPEIIYATDVLVIETECPGVHINMIKDDAKQYINARYTLFDAFIKMIKNSFLHGDLHDGNILYHDSTIYVLDYGIALGVNSNDRKIIRNLIKAYNIFYTTGDCSRLLNVIRNFTTMSITNENIERLRNIILSCTTRVGCDNETKTLFLTDNMFKMFDELFLFFSSNGIYLKYTILHILLTLSIIEADITNEFSIDFIRESLSRYKGFA